MKTRLLFPNRDSDWRPVADAISRAQALRNGRADRTVDSRADDGLPWNAAALAEDLSLTPLLQAAAGDADDLQAVLRRELLLAAGNDLATIRYRQAMLGDALAHADAVRELHALAADAVADARRHYLDSLLQRYPDAVLRWAIELLRRAFGWIARLRELAAEGWRAPGWCEFFARLGADFDSSALAELDAVLDRLYLNDGMVLSAAPGAGLRGVDFRLHPPLVQQLGWFGRRLRRWFPVLFRAEADTHAFSVAPGDEAGNRALGEFRDSATAIAARTLAEAATRIIDFFRTLRVEAAFYVAALNLHDRLRSAGMPTCFPQLNDAPLTLHFAGLCEPSLGLRGPGVVGNDVDADGATLVVITGANQGGKSTLLRAIGVAQLMAQCGLFVAAREFATACVPAIITHYPRAEDSNLAHGKFDEELARMDAIVGHFTPGMLLLLNESFASTSEREASAIADDVLEALRGAGARVLFVTHLHEYAHQAAARADAAALFLRAVRDADGNRPFRITPGAPLRTSFGEDLYRRIFDEPAPD